MAHQSQFIARYGASSNCSFEQLAKNVSEMFIGPFGSSLKNECFVEKNEAFCVVYEQKHAIEKSIGIPFRYVNLEKYIELKRFEVLPGDIIVSCRGTVGEVFLIPQGAPLGIMHPSIMKIRLNPSSYISDFFVFAVEEYMREQDSKNLGTGVKMAVTAGEMAKERFPKPSLREQQTFVSIAHQADKSKFAGLKSQFIEMFGVLQENTKGFPQKKLGEIAFITKLAGFEYTKYIKYQRKGDIIMVRGLNCKQGKLVLDDIYWIDKETSSFLYRSQLSKGDIVLTYVGTVGEVALIDEDNKYHLAPNVAKISLYNKTEQNPEYWTYALLFSRDYVTHFAASTTQAAISMEKIRDIVFPIPNYQQQCGFVPFLHQADKSKFELKNAIEKIDKVMRALMQ